jgi:hypothetical protein
MANGNSGEPVQKTFSLFEKMADSKAKKEKSSKRKGDPDGKLQEFAETYPVHSDAKPKKTKSAKPKKELVQKTIADSFATALKKSQSKEDHESSKEVTIPPRVIDHIQELKILDRTTDEYWNLMKKVVTPAWNKTVAFRDECSKMMSKTVSEDFIAEFAIKRLGNKPAIKNHMMDLKVISSNFLYFYKFSRECDRSRSYSRCLTVLILILYGFLAQMESSLSMCCT